MAQAVPRSCARCLQLPKHGNSLDELEDAFACNEQSIRYAIADGASESICAGEWARLLCETFVADTSPKPELGKWIKNAQSAWKKQIVDQPKYWHVQEKLRDGAFATFLGLQIEVHNEDFRWRAMAIGDSCLFLIRGDALCRAFPIEQAAAFGTRPNLIGSRQRDGLRASAVSSTLVPGDLIMLMTDALSEWFLTENESGLTPWRHLEELSINDFPDWINARRRDASLKNDDVTLVSFRFDPSKDHSAK